MCTLKEPKWRIEKFFMANQTMLSKYVLLGYKATKKCKGVFDIKIGA